MTDSVGKECRGKSQEHADAVALVGFLMDQGGNTPLPNAEVAYRLGFTTRHGKQIEVDTPRFY